MQGHQPIVLMLKNHGFYEHDTIVSAKAEAQRLACHFTATTVVYVPVAIVRPPVGLRVEPIVPDKTQLVAAGIISEDDDLPF